MSIFKTIKFAFWFRKNIGNDFTIQINKSTYTTYGADKVSVTPSGYIATKVF